MLFKDSGFLFGNKWGNPDGWFKSFLPYGSNSFLNIPVNRIKINPVTHKRLITIIDLNIFQFRQHFSKTVKVLLDIFVANIRSITIPGTPACRYRFDLSLRMVFGDLECQLIK